MALLRYQAAETANIAKAASEAKRVAAMGAAIAKRDAVATADELASAAAADKAIVVSAPATAISTGEPGEIAFDTSYFYVCVSANVWRRVAIAVW